MYSKYLQYCLLVLLIFDLYLHDTSLAAISPKYVPFIQIQRNEKGVDNGRRGVNDEEGFLFELHNSAGSGHFDENRNVDLPHFRNYNELTLFCHSIVTKYSNITSMFSIGKSVQGRDIWAMEISNNAGINEIEPEVKLVANIHGDEVVGREMLLYLIEYLCVGYGNNPRVTDIVNSIDIFVIPTMNPDGFEMERRSNANFKDLNRNFPDQFHDPDNTWIGRQAETAAIMKFTQNKHFVISASLHGGALVANYPLDGNADHLNVYTATPDDDIFRKLALIYSSNHDLMYNSYEFPQGITNGADWYVLYGGMQDWNYLWNGCLALTFELSNVKWPQDNTIPSFWEDNRESLLCYLEAVHLGIRGIVLDHQTNRPVSANISVQKESLITLQMIRTDPENGDYYRPLAAGLYIISVVAEGYFSANQTIIIPEFQNRTIHVDFFLVSFDSQENNSSTTLPFCIYFHMIIILFFLHKLI